MDASDFSPAQARFKLTLLDKQAEARNSYEVYSQMKDLGLPDEIIEILQKIFKVTSKVAGKVVSIGKIVVLELIGYVAKHPLQVAGLAAGLYTTYTLGVAVHTLFSLVPSLAQVPVLGWGLSKLAMLIASLCKTVLTPFIIASPIVGAVVGEVAENKFPEVSQSAREVAKDFFNLISKIINSIRDDLKFSGPIPACA